MTSPLLTEVLVWFASTLRSLATPLVAVSVCGSTPVPVGSRVRASFVLREAKAVRADQRQLRYDATIEIEGSERPALVAEWLMRYVV